MIVLAAGVEAMVDATYGKVQAGVVFHTSWTVGLLLAAPLVYLEIRQWRQGPRSGSERGPPADSDRM